MTKTPNLNLNVPDYQDQRWDVPVNENWNLIDTAIGKTVNYDNITNCITYIPQDIKLELNNGTLTLKSGSVITYPDGEQLQLTADKTVSLTSDSGKELVVARRSDLNTVAFSYDLCFSGSVAPTGYSGNALWYDTTNNIIKNKTGSGTVWNNDWSFPVAEITASDGVVSSIDQVFNGFGYIGSTIFALPGVKGLIPNGRNADGSLKNTEFTINFVQIRTESNQNNPAYICLGLDRDFYRPYYVQKEQPTTSGLWYNPITNLLKRSTDSGVTWISRREALVGQYITDSTGKITSFTPKTPFHAVDYNDFAPVKDQVDTNTTALTTKANVGLDNLNADGQMLVDSQNGTISNCILEIPQNLKLTLENNVLTLKSGSVVTLSGSTYTTHTTTQDVTFTYDGGAVGTKYVLFLYVGSFYRLERVEWNKITSGETDSFAGVENHLWFDTTNKEIKFFRNSTDTYSLFAYPLAVIEKATSFYTFAKDSNGNDMIFNGAGFIGHHAFIYPNVKGLYGNRFNADGTLASGVAATSSLYIIEMPTGQAYTGFNRWIGLTGASSNIEDLMFWRAYKEVDTPDELTTQEYIRQYVKTENKIEVYAGSSFLPDRYNYYKGVPFIEFNYNGTTVTDFTIRQPVRVATTEMLDKKQDTLISGTNIKTINSTSLLGSGDISTTPSWGQITGTLSNQTDLNNALALKANNNKFQTAESVPSTFTDGVWLAVFEGGQQ